MRCWISRVLLISGPGWRGVETCTARMGVKVQWAVVRQGLLDCVGAAPCGEGLCSCLAVLSLIFRLGCSSRVTSCFWWWAWQKRHRVLSRRVGWLAQGGIPLCPVTAAPGPWQSRPSFRCVDWSGSQRQAVLLAVSGALLPAAAAGGWTSAGDGGLYLLGTGDQGTGTAARWVVSAADQ